MTLSFIRESSRAKTKLGAAIRDKLRIKSGIFDVMMGMEASNGSFLVYTTVPRRLEMTEEGYIRPQCPPLEREREIFRKYESGETQTSLALN